LQGTVEEKIMKLQQRKMEMAASALEARSKDELQKMRLEELNLLFS
jgi:SNF2 family DNA or RNA helicase